MSKIRITVVAKAAAKRLVYGWAMISQTTDGKQVVDHQDDLIDVDELEKAAAEFVKNYRAGGVMHQGEATSELAASLVFTPDIQKALGLSERSLPAAWFVGFRVSPEVYARVESGELPMFSIQGECDREEVA